MLSLTLSNFLSLGLVFSFTRSVSPAGLVLPVGSPPTNGSNTNISVSSLTFDSLLDIDGTLSEDISFIGSEGRSPIIQKVKLDDVSATAKKRAFTDVSADSLRGQMLERRVQRPVSSAPFPLDSHSYTYPAFADGAMIANGFLSMNYILSPEDGESEIETQRYVALRNAVFWLIREFNDQNRLSRAVAAGPQRQTYHPAAQTGPRFELTLTYTPGPIALARVYVRDIVNQLEPLILHGLLGPFELTIRLRGQVVLVIAMRELSTPTLGDPNPPSGPDPVNTPTPTSGTGGSPRSAFEKYTNSRRAAKRKRQEQTDQSGRNTQNTDAQNLALPFMQPARDPLSWRLPLYNKPGHWELR